MASLDQEEIAMKQGNIDFASAHISADNLALAQEALPTDQARKLEPGCITWAIWYGSQRGQMTVWPSGRGAIYLGGDSEWGEWDAQSGILTTDAGTRYDDNGIDIDMDAAETES